MHDLCAQLEIGTHMSAKVSIPGRVRESLIITDATTQSEAGAL